MAKRDKVRARKQKKMRMARVTVRHRTTAGKTHLNSKKLSSAGPASGAGALPALLHKWSRGAALLVIGDGDFTFSRALCRLVARLPGAADPARAAADVVATSFDARSVVTSKYGKARECIAEVEAMGATVLHGVDARKLQASLRAAADGAGVSLPAAFSHVLFNFPHVGKQRVHMNRLLVRDTLLSARHVLTPLGEISITLKTKPPYSNWQLEESAAVAKLMQRRDMRFDAQEFPGYRHATTDPGAKSFDTSHCRTFVFGHTPESVAVTTAAAETGAKKKSVQPAVPAGAAAPTPVPATAPAVQRVDVVDIVPTLPSVEQPPRRLAVFCADVRCGQGTVKCVPRVGTVVRLSHVAVQQQEMPEDAGPVVLMVNGHALATLRPAKLQAPLCGVVLDGPFELQAAGDASSCTVAVLGTVVPV